MDKALVYAAERMNSERPGELYERVCQGKTVSMYTTAKSETSQWLVPLDKGLRALNINFETLPENPETLAELLIENDFSEVPISEPGLVRRQLISGPERAYASFGGNQTRNVENYTSLRFGGEPFGIFLPESYVDMPKIF